MGQRHLLRSIAGGLRRGSRPNPGTDLKFSTRQPILRQGSQSPEALVNPRLKQREDAMEVHPSGSGPASGPGPKRPRESTPAPAREPVGPGPAGSQSTAGDAVEISGTARELLAASGAPVGSPLDLDPERAREVLARIASGFYDRPEVRARTLSRLAHELGQPPTSTAER